MATTPEQLEEIYANSIGTEQYHSNFAGLLYTDGVKLLAEEAGAYWLIDVIASHQIASIVRREPFQVWRMRVTPYNEATIEAFDDLPGRRLAKQGIPYTDFPPGEWKFYVVNGVLMLPSEY